MNYIEISIGSVGLIIAIWTLLLQRKEVIKNGKINALIHSSNLVEERIEYYREIIEDKQKNGESWEGLANRVNLELRPLKTKIDEKFLDLVDTYDDFNYSYEVKKALNSKS